MRDVHVGSSRMVDAVKHVIEMGLTHFDTDLGFADTAEV
jgi:hypothetical protein